MLQINATLKSLEIDDNSFTIVGFQRIRDGLMRNSTLQQMTMPVFDAMSLKKKRQSGAGGTLSGTQRSSSLQSMNTLSSIIKEMETKLSQNYSRPKAVPSKTAGATDDGMKFRFIVRTAFFFFFVVLLFFFQLISLGLECDETEGT